MGNGLVKEKLFRRATQSRVRQEPVTTSRGETKICIAAPRWEGFIEPLAVKDPLPEMPLYLTTQGHVLVPLEATYQSAWEAVPAFWRETLSRAAAVS